MKLITVLGHHYIHQIISSKINKSFYVLVYQGFDLTNDGYYCRKKFLNINKAKDFIKEEQKEIEIKNFSGFNLEYDSDIAKVDPQHLIKTIKDIDHSTVDAIFVSCTALRIVEVLQEAEDLIKKTVISSNQAIIWDSIRSVEIKSSIEGFGKLLLN